MRILHKAGKYAARRERKALWRGIVTAIAAVVVFCTTYALILPAITMETQSFSCGLEAHTHAEECYQLTCDMQEYFSHSHTEECYEDGALVCTLTEQICHHHGPDCYSKAEPICGRTEAAAHAHTEQCHTLQRVVVCGQEECEAHTHSEDCYTAQTIPCGLAETPGHSHGEECYTDGVLTCNQEETPGHVHSSECSQTRQVLTCTLAETPGHTHGEECFQEQSVLSCGLEETEGHTHGAECYPGDFQPELICGQEDIPEHRHSEGCYVCICEKQEHLHSEACVDSHEAFLENQDNMTVGTEPAGPDDPEIPWNDPDAAETAGYLLICDVEEEGHVHDEECYFPMDELELLSQTADYASGNGREESGVMPLEEGNSGVLPVDKLSAINTEYNPTTDSFSTSVQIEFDFPAIDGKQAVTAGTVYTYNYPPVVSIPEGMLNAPQTLKDKHDRDAGTYTFVKNEDGTYSVQVVFSSEYVDKYVVANAPVSGFISFNWEFSKEKLHGNKISLGEADEGVTIVDGIDYPADKTESYDIDVGKDGSWVRDGDKLVYTVYVRTTKGTPDSIQLTDTLSELNSSNSPTTLENLGVGSPTVVVEKGKATYYYQDWNKAWGLTGEGEWTEVSGFDSNYVGNGTLQMSLGKLTAINTVDGNNYPCIISDTYKITYTYPITDQTVEKVPLRNVVSVTATDSAKGQTITDGASKDVTVNKDFSYTVAKNGAPSSKKPGYIQWTVTVNSNEQNLVGAILTDQMLGLVEKAEDISVSSPNAGSSGADINRDENGRIQSISFVATDENGTNNNIYTITYFTPVDGGWDGTTVNNRATLDPDPNTPGDEKDADAMATVKGVQLDKSGSHNAQSNKIDWTITVNPEKLDIAGATLTDSMFSQLTQGNFTITSSGENNTGYEFVYDENGTTITGITFPAQADGKNTLSFVIQYSTDIPTVDGSPASSVENIATLSPGEGKTGTPITVNPRVVLEQPSLGKTGQYDWNGHIWWTVTVNENGKNIAGAELTDSMLSQLIPGTITVKDGSYQTADPSQYEIHTDGAGKVTKITFKQIGDTKSNFNKYVITYATEAWQEWKDRNVHNEAVLSLDGTNITAPADVPVQGSGQVQKSAGTGEVNGNTLTIPWTVTLTVPKGGLPIDTIVIDDVTKKDDWNKNENQWITDEQKQRLIEAGLTWTGGESFVPVNVPLNDTSNGTIITFEGTGGKYQSFKIDFTKALIPPDGATKLTFTYWTTCDLSSAPMGVNVFYNFVNADGRTTSAEYRHTMPGVLKTDGDGKTEPLTVSNEGSLTWKIEAYVAAGSHELILEDTLPVGVLLDSLQVTSLKGLNAALSIGADGGITGTDENCGYTISGAYSDAPDGENASSEENTEKAKLITLHIASTQGFPEGEKITLTVNCSVKNAATVSGTKTLTNTVSMKLDEVGIGSSSHTQNWSYKQFQRAVVSKSGEWDNNARELTYTVILNPDGKWLVNENVKTLELTDELTYPNKVTTTSDTVDWDRPEASLEIKLKPGSVKLYDTSQNPEKEITWDWRRSSAPKYDWGGNEIINTITGTVPNGVPLKLVYTYIVSSDARKDYHFDLPVENVAYLAGENNEETTWDAEKKWANQFSSGGVTTTPSLRLLKVDENSYNTALGGTTFSVYAYNMENGTREENFTKQITTGADGEVLIIWEDPVTKETPYAKNVLYVVYETDARSDYILPDSPEEFYFYFSGGTVPENWKTPTEIAPNAMDLTKQGDTVYVTNTPKPTASIEVQKVWQDKDGNDVNNPGGSVNVSLYRKTTQSAASGGGEVTVTFNVTRQNYGNDLACGEPYTVTCRSGTVFSFTINTWGTPSVSVNGTALEPGTPTTGSYGEPNKDYPYQFTATENTVVTGYADNNNANTLTYTYVEPPASAEPGNPEGPSAAEGTFCEAVTLNNDNGWKHTFTKLPLTGEDAEGNTVNYYYYVIEDAVDNYTTTYENNGGVQSGTIKVYNRALSNPSYSLPETGGVGWEGYTVTGLLVSIGAVLGLMKKRKKGER